MDNNNNTTPHPSNLFKFFPPSNWCGPEKSSRFRIYLLEYTPFLPLQPQMHLIENISNVSIRWRSKLSHWLNTVCALPCKTLFVVEDDDMVTRKLGKSIKETTALSRINSYTSLSFTGDAAYSSKSAWQGVEVVANDPPSPLLPPPPQVLLLLVAGAGTPTILFCDMMLRVFSSGGFFVDVDMA